MPFWEKMKCKSVDVAKITFETRLGGKKRRIYANGIKRNEDDCEYHSPAYPLFFEPGLMEINPILFSYLLSTGRQSDVFLTRKNHIHI